MRFFQFITLSFLFIFAVACGDNANQTADAEAEAQRIADSLAAIPAAITLDPMPETTGFPDASIDDWAYKGGKFTYTASNYTFGTQTPDADAVMCANSAEGQHVHLIIDNEPYIAKYTPEFEQTIADGPHHILTFLSRSYHESIKTPAAHRAVMAEVAGGAFTSSTEITEPMLFYSRPKGSYKGEKETTNVMLDFYPVNVTLGQDGYFVEAVVNGTETFKITEWKPFFLKGLPMGENTVKLTLMKDDAMVETPLNPVTRTFTLEALPTEM